MKNKSYPRINRVIYGKPWCITEGSYLNIHDIYQAHLKGIGPKKAYDWDDDDNDSVSNAQPYTLANTTAIVQLTGVILKHASSLDQMCGAVDIDTFVNNVEQAYNDVRVRNILIDINSPGGTVTGVPEASAYIKNMIKSGNKPVYSFSDSLICSAAYWMACSTEGIFVTPSSDIGSIGVYTLLYDYSVQFANEGVKPVMIKAGKYKGEGAQGMSIDQPTIDRIQLEVDDIYDDFTSVVTQARGDVNEDNMQGQTFSGKNSVKINLADGIVNNINECLTFINSVDTK